MQQLSNVILSDRVCILHVYVHQVVRHSQNLPVHSQVSCKRVSSAAALCWTLLYRSVLFYAALCCCVLIFAVL